MGFKFEMCQQVVIKVSREIAEVLGRAEFANRESEYLLRYCAADGRAVEQWWQESALRSSVHA